MSCNLVSGEVRWEVLYGVRQFVGDSVQEAVREDVVCLQCTVQCAIRPVASVTVVAMSFGAVFGGGAFTVSFVRAGVAEEGCIALVWEAASSTVQSLAIVESFGALVAAEELTSSLALIACIFPLLDLGFTRGFPILAHFPLTMWVVEIRSLLNVAARCGLVWYFVGWIEARVFVKRPSQCDVRRAEARVGRSPQAA